MLPDNMLSGSNMSTTFLVPFREDRLIDYEWGGIELSDTSHGLDYQVWRCWFDEPTKEVRINRLSEPLTTYIVYTSIAIPIVSIGLSFDGNMRATICWTSVNGDCYLYYYNPVTASMDTATFNNVTNACISMDDHRQFNVSNADIILAYTRGTQLLYRQQRDRYLIERELSNSSPGNLWQIGMSTQNRFQFGYRICGN